MLESEGQSIGAIFACAAAAYLIGAIPTGYVVARAFGVDITAHGSGNVGATNVARVVGKRAGVITLLIDIFKGVMGVVAGALFGNPWLGGTAVVAGHCFSIPPYLRGGKGVATSLGVCAALDIRFAGVALAIFAAVFFWQRIVSLGSVTTALLTPLAALLLSSEPRLFQSLVPIGVIIVYRHRENLQRLMRGEEKRFASS